MRSAILTCIMIALNMVVAANAADEGRAPRDFSSATLDVRVHGFRWVDSVQADPKISGTGIEVAETSMIRAAEGFRLVSVRCGFELKGEREAVRSPKDEIVLLCAKTNCVPVGAFTGTPLEGPIWNLSALACAIMTPEVVFAVPATATARDLFVKTAASEPVPLARLPELGESPKAGGAIIAE